MKNLKYTWDRLHKDTHTLASHMKESFNPDFVVGISRGGLIPAVILSHYFNAKLIPLEWSLRDSKVKDVDALNRIINLANSFTRKILIVDDIVDSGETFQDLRFLIKDSPYVKYSSLWFNPDQCRASVDYTVNLIHRSVDKRWLDFPWEN